MGAATQSLDLSRCVLSLCDLSKANSHETFQRPSKRLIVANLFGGLRFSDARIEAVDSKPRRKIVLRTPTRLVEPEE